ncbi:MAG: DUF4258 domain-containing protein [Bacteroidota bacterium]|nr:DUF4258 domain-containing protein [Bacteroidota bacterium]
MKSRVTLYSAMLILLIVGIWLLKETKFFNQASPQVRFRDTTHLVLTHHAMCRMDCRHITRKEITEIITEGNVNYSKSELSKKGDETYAIEGYTTEEQHLRIVVSPADDGLVVVTCIDLDRDWPCNCE